MTQTHIYREPTHIELLDILLQWTKRNCIHRTRHCKPSGSIFEQLKTKDSKIQPRLKNIREDKAKKNSNLIYSPWNSIKDVRNECVKLRKPDICTLSMTKE